MRKYLPAALLLTLIGTIYHDVCASHVRAGEITARRISGSSLTYEITFTGCYDQVGGSDAARTQNSVRFYVGSVGPIEVARKTPIANIGNGTSRNEYVFTYTFPAPGTFTISTSIINRNIYY
ncbi:hypothetical protein [Persicitalea jodogahamensis]|uniref:Uncharacterized protein n=1 Tax=Persicitalea jodogahamensis TaxID=402147 RepID=A0A8J3DB00_9BACT|nr:hypothetical protein [Persicitalea jodogahamensis]GHB77978.1 hypothetical protein GCM10007390_35210 [Persicitalea jodogahamensis]